MTTEMTEPLTPNEQPAVPPTVHPRDAVIPDMPRKGIEFTPKMVQAILLGVKNTTRRLVKGAPDPVLFIPDPAHYFPTMEGRVATFSGTLRGEQVTLTIPCPFGAPGDLLYVKETFATRTTLEADAAPSRRRHYTYYRSRTPDFDPASEMNFHDYGGQWQPARLMPRVLSRIYLTLTGLHAEPLRAIDFLGAAREGFVNLHDFRVAWDKLHPDKPYMLNPYVWVLTFTVAWTDKENA